MVTCVRSVVVSIFIAVSSSGSIVRETNSRHSPAPVGTPVRIITAGLIRQQEVEHLDIVIVYLNSDSCTPIQCYSPYLLSAGGESFREVRQGVFAVIEI